MGIVIVGAGIGGLVAALSLHAVGCDDVRVYERVEEFRALGVGINLLPHAMRELTELGLGDEIAALGIPTGTLTYTNRYGQLIWSEPRGVAAGYRWPQISMLRGTLLRALVAAVRDRLGDDCIQLGHTLARIDHGDQSDTATFESRTGTTHVEAEVIVAADGIGSVVRRQHFPDEGRPVWNGLTLWRGIATAPAFLDGRTMIMAGDGELKFVAYPLGPPGDDGSARVNFIAQRRGYDAEVVDWNHAVDAAPIVDLFRDWRFEWLDVPGLVAAAPEILEYPMVDRDPLPRWTFGRTTLLGDAAHPMYPNGSNGASQAVLDARTLAFHLATARSATAALDAYEDARRPPTTELVLANRRQGPEEVMLLARERAPQGFTNIDDVIPAAERADIAERYKRAAGFLPEILNARPSLTPPPR